MFILKLAHLLIHIFLTMPRTYIQIAFTKLEDSYCKGTYNRKYESLDDAQKACENDAQCFGVYDRNCGQNNVDKSKRYQRCNIDKNKERHTSVSKRCVYVKGV